MRFGKVEALCSTGREPGIHNLEKWPPKHAVRNPASSQIGKFTGDKR